MVRIFLAVAWMQARSLWNTFVRVAERDTFAMVMMGVTLMITLGSSLGFGGLVFVTTFFRGRSDPGVLLIWVLGAMFLMTVLQAAAGERGFSLDLRRFLVLPIPPRSLAVLEVLASMAAPQTWVFIPVVLALVFGLAINLGFWTGVVAALGAVTNLLIAVALQRVAINGATLAGRRARELLAVGLLISWIALMFIFLDPAGATPSIRSALRGTPPELIAGIVEHVAGTGAREGIALRIAGLAVWAGGVLLAHGWITSRLVAAGGAPQGARRVRRVGGRWHLLTRVFGSPTVGVGSADLRTLLRLPAMWLLLVMPAMIGVFIGGMREDLTTPGIEGQLDDIGGVISVMFLVAAPSVFSNVLLLNFFGTDYEAVGHYALFPARLRSVFSGKALSRLAFVFLQLLGLGLALRLRGMGDERLLLAGTLGGLSAGVWLLAAGNLTSIRLPYRIATAYRREGAATSAFRSMLGTLIAGLVAAPVAITMFVTTLFAGALGALAAAVAFGIIGAIVWFLSAGIASGWLNERGPFLLQELSREP